MNKLYPSFLQNPQLYEFRCNIDEKNKIDSPVTLQWEPTFTKFDENKIKKQIKFPTIYDAKTNEIFVLNLKEVLNLMNTINKKKGYPVTS